MSRAVAVGERALRVRLSAAPSRDMVDALRALDGVTDVVVTDAHAMVVAATREALPEVAEVIAVVDRPSVAAEGREHVIAARYDGADLEVAASALGMSAEELVSRHAAGVYRVAFVGFMPGFAYLDGLDPSLSLPRLATPRAKVPAGAVGIAGARTAVYPFASPGGWNLIASAVAPALFDPATGARLALGDVVRFVPC